MAHLSVKYKKMNLQHFLAASFYVAGKWMTRHSVVLYPGLIAKKIFPGKILQVRIQSFKAGRKYDALSM